MATYAVTRGISPNFAEALIAGERQPIDVGLARAQHAAYVDALRSAGLSVVTLPPDPAHPDACFVEDQAVIADGVAVITRSGAPSRRGEAVSLVPALAALAPIWMPEPATLDGGDVLRLGQTLVVGLSKRTNAAGAAFLGRILGLEVRTVGVGGLHLKCVCSAPRPDLVLLAEQTLSPDVFRGLGVEVVQTPERYPANTLGLGDRVLVAAGFPRTAEILDASGLNVVCLEVSEIRKADGSLTCLSLLW